MPGCRRIFYRGLPYGKRSTEKKVFFRALFIHFLFPDHGKGTKEAVCPTGYKCSFDINGNGVPCGMHFKNRKELNKHKVDAKHIKKKKADGGEEGENNEVEAVAE